MTLATSLLTEMLYQVKTDLQGLFLYGAVGTSGTAATASDTTLGAEAFRDAIDEFDTSDSDSVTASIRILTTEANGNTVREVAFGSGASEAIDACDATTGWTDSADMTVSLNNTTFNEGTGSINLTKDGTSSATASTSKTTTTLTFSSSKKLYLWVYIKDATAYAKLATSSCLTVRFGSDSSNYYQWTKNAADLATGWNFIGFLTIATASTTGSPSLSGMDYTYVGITATGSGITWSAGDFIMDNITLTSPTQYSRNTPTAISKVDSIQLYFDLQIDIEVTEET